ncbi:MAG: hypothetical protein IJ131_11670 [Eggerthellaceae bacterium]|nr:hypothetical protein [Eggerthellaceae bacterium]
MKNWFRKRIIGLVAACALAISFAPHTALARSLGAPQSAAGNALAAVGRPLAPTFDALGGAFAVVAVIAVIALVALGYSLHRRNKDKDR